MALPSALPSRELDKFEEVSGQAAVRVSVVSGGSGSVSVYSKRVDEVGQTTYIGEATVGTATSSASWRIQKLVQSGGDLSITWADGVSTFTKVWDDRATYTYS